MRLLTYDELPKSLRESNKYWDFFKASKKGTSTIILYRKDFEKQTWKKHGPYWSLEGRRTEKEEELNKRVNESYSKELPEAQEISN